MNERKKHEQKLREEMERCMLLSAEDKKFWLDHVDSLPDHVLENVLQAVQEKNSKIDEYMAAALVEDKDHKYLSELKAKIKKIKDKAFAIAEKGEKESAEEILKRLEKLL